MLAAIPLVGTASVLFFCHAAEQGTQNYFKIDG
jgi:hypothetical protein